MATEDPDGGDDQLLKAVGDRIRSLRKREHASQAAFAAATGMSQKYVSRLERGEQNLNLRSISRIALAFGMTMSQLLEGIEADPATRDIRPYRRQGES